MKSGVLILVLLLLSWSTAWAQDPVATVEVQIEGPSEVVGFSGGFERTDLCVGLTSGENRRLLVPFLSRDGLGEQFALARLGASQSAADLRWDQESIESPQPWKDLPRSLRSRGLPSLAAVRPRVGGLRWVWLTVAVLIVLGLRRRPWRALLAGALCGTTLYWLPAAPIAPPVVRLLEGDAASGRWIELRGARDRLELEPVSTGWVRHLPQTADRRLEVHEHSGRARWSILSAGARIYFMREVLAVEAPGPQGPGSHVFEEVWLKESGVGWTARGPWRGQGALPNALPAGVSPPGWLVAGLPQGVPILAGRLADEDGNGAWLRYVGFE